MSLITNDNEIFFLDKIKRNLRIHFTFFLNKKLLYFTDYWSMGMIGRIAAILLKFGGNTKIGQRCR